MKKFLLLLIASVQTVQVSALAAQESKTSAYWEALIAEHRKGSDNQIEIAERLDQSLTLYRGGNLPDAETAIRGVLEARLPEQPNYAPLLLLSAVSAEAGNLSASRDAALKWFFSHQLDQSPDLCSGLWRDFEAGLANATADSDVAETVSKRVATPLAGEPMADYTGFALRAVCPPTISRPVRDVYGFQDDALFLELFSRF